MYPASHHSFPANCSHAWGPWWHSMFDDAVLASSVYVITGFMQCIKMYELLSGGSLLQTHSDRGSGIRLGSRGNINSKEVSTVALFSLDLPHPWILWFEQLVLSITFCVSHKPQPVHTQAGLSLLVSYCMHIRIEGTTQGVELGKELSLLVKEWSSPKSCSPWADADSPQPVKFWATWVGTKFGSHR